MFLAVVKAAGPLRRQADIHKLTDDEEQKQGPVKSAKCLFVHKNA